MQFLPPESLRLFIALELPPEVRKALAAVQQRAQSADGERAMRWVSLDSMHLTLKFLGDTPADRQPAIESALGLAVQKFVPFSLTLAGLGCFPNFRKPRVAWAGIQGQIEPLLALQAAVEATISPLGYPTDSRPFSAHITLGRARQESSAAKLASLGEKLAAMQVGDLATWAVDSVSLMKSDLRPSGAVYTCLHKVMLK